MDKQTMIKKIYKVVKPTFFAFVSIDWHYWQDIEHVMIWDVLDFIDDWDFANMESQIYQQDRIKIDDPNEDNITSIITILDLRKEKRKPIENQSQKCIQYVYNLIKDK